MNKFSNFKKYRKLNLLTLTFLLLLFVDCKKENTLSVEVEKKFSRLRFEKIGQIMLYYGQWCIPTKNELLCNQVVDPLRRAYKLILYDLSGNIKREKLIKSGEGPEEIMGIQQTWISENGDVLCIDNNYLKTIDTKTLEIRAIAKLSNLIDGYMRKYIFQRFSSPSFEIGNSSIVTSFESTGYPEDLTYYIVKFEGLFDKLKIIAKLKKKREAVMGVGFNELIRKREFLVDYFHMLRSAILFSVYWKEGLIFLIPEIEYPCIELLDISGKKIGRYSIDMNYKSIKVNEKELKFFYDWVMSDVPPFFKNFKHVLYIPPYAPPLQGIKVIDDFLLIITGKRDSEKRMNEVLVYRLPSFHYEGSFEIPFPNGPFLIPLWFQNYYITKELLKKEEDYYILFNIYKIEKK